MWPMCAGTRARTRRSPAGKSSSAAPHRRPRGRPARGLPLLLSTRPPGAVARLRRPPRRRLPAAGGGRGVGGVADDDGMDITVRTARPEEYPELGELVARAYLSGGLLDLGEADPYLETLRDAAGRAGHAELLVAEGDRGELLGTVTFVGRGGPFAERARQDEGEFRMLGVRESARGRGVGEALVTACSDRARALGLSGLVLSTPADHACRPPPLPAPRVPSGRRAGLESGPGRHPVGLRAAPVNALPPGPTAASGPGGRSPRRCPTRRGTAQDMGCLLKPSTRCMVSHGCRPRRRGIRCESGTVPQR